MDKALEEVCARYKKSNDLLSLLKEVQKNNRHFSPEIMSDIASLWDVPVAEIYGLVTFHPFLSIKPVGHNIVRVCKSLPCSLKNSQAIIETLCMELDIRPGETTDDGQFSIQEVNCIGACDNTPAMMINDKLYDDLTPEKVKTILKRLFSNSSKNSLS